jgi:hypothetical protein
MTALKKLALSTLTVTALSACAISAPSAQDVLRLANVAVIALRAAATTRHRSAPGAESRMSLMSARQEFFTSLAAMSLFKATARKSIAGSGFKTL